MASGHQSSSEPVEPTRVWTREEWQAEQPWGSMPKGDLRRFFKDEGFAHIYGGGPDKLRDIYERHYGSPTGRMNVQGPPMQWPRKGTRFDGKG